MAASSGNGLGVTLGNGAGTFQSSQGVVLPSQLPAGSAAYRPVQTPTSTAAART